MLSLNIYFYLNADVCIKHDMRVCVRYTSSRACNVMLVNDFLKLLHQRRVNQV